MMTSAILSLSSRAATSNLCSSQTASRQARFRIGAERLKRAVIEILPVAWAQILRRLCRAAILAYLT